jgi:hypothetical protein
VVVQVVLVEEVLVKMLGPGPGGAVLEQLILVVEVEVEVVLLIRWCWWKRSSYFKYA